MVSIEHLRRVWHADRERFLLRTPGPVPLGLAYVLLDETNPSSELVVIFPDYALRISLGTFSIWLGKILQNNEFATLPTPLNLPMCIFTPLTENIFRSALS